LSAGLASRAEAGVEVRAPFTYVRAGYGVEVIAPFTYVRVGRPPVVVAQPVIEGERIHAPRPVEGAVQVQAIRHADFARAFRPTAGNYEVDFIHPYTCCPVRVCFTLPCGCPRVRCDRNELEFDYGKYEVEIHFKRDGRVKVEYDD
jgi:hypothetical protein